MIQRWRTAAFTSLALAGLCVLSLSASNPGVSLIGIGSIPGNALDLSGLDGQSICQADPPNACIDQATLGGFGSGLTYTGRNNVFLAVPDRGPFDGRTDVPYLDRFHFLYMKVNVGSAFPNITTNLLDTRFLKNERNRNFVGDAYAFDPADPDNPRKTFRFDPEGVVVGRDESFFVSDEYGPYLFEFNPRGRLVRRLDVPSKFLLKDPPLGASSGDVDVNGNSLELFLNATGRQANRGMEGLAITPDGKWLVGIMQNALLQDNGFDTATSSRVGFNNRIVKLNLRTGETFEYVYTMDAVNRGKGVNDLLAINDHEFLVLERDNRTKLATPPTTPETKRLYKIDLNQAGLTDVSSIVSLPKTVAELALAVPPIVPVTKSLVIDLLDSSYVVDATTVPPTTIKDVVAEKIEGLAWGPDLPDGRHVLYVVSDNDLNTAVATQIYAFAIDGSLANIDYQRQRISESLFEHDDDDHGGR